MSAIDRLWDVLGWNRRKARGGKAYWSIVASKGVFHPYPKRQPAILLLDCCVEKVAIHYGDPQKTWRAKISPGSCEGEQICPTSDSFDLGEDQIIPGQQFKISRNI